MGQSPVSLAKTLTTKGDVLPSVLTTLFKMVVGGVWTDVPTSQQIFLKVARLLSQCLPLMDLAAFIVQMVTQKIVKQDCVCHVLIKEPVIFIVLEGKFKVSMMLRGLKIV
jgi:hypothetical protein